MVHPNISVSLPGGPKLKGSHCRACSAYSKTCAGPFGPFISCCAQKASRAFVKQIFEYKGGEKGRGGKSSTDREYSVGEKQMQKQGVFSSTKLLALLLIVVKTTTT